MSPPAKAVFDCNIFLQALANPDGPAGQCLELAFSGKVELYTSPTILGEIRRVTSRPKLIAKFALRVESVTKLLDNLPKASVVFPVVPAVWAYARDPDDAHYVNLALAAEAPRIISRDRDLLDLMDPLNAEATEFQRCYPRLRVVNPVVFMREMTA